jgi:hypothetical protein
MPTHPLMLLPKSNSPEEFESMCKDVLSIVFQTRFTHYGRKGQKQYGIDLIMQTSSPDCIVAQCKNYYLNSQDKLRSQLSEDIQAAKNAPFSISKFIAMTSMNRDTNIWNFIKEVNAPFEIQLMFWEDIQVIICTNLNLLSIYYPSFYYSQEIPITAQNKIISNTKLLKNAAQNIYDDYSNYSIAKYYDPDCVLYNQYVSMMNAANDLLKVKDQWYKQLQENKIASSIENLINNIPKFYDESMDGTGASMVYTLTNLLEYFTDKDKHREFIMLCNKIIKRTENL